MSEDYNGWKNRETWAVMLHLDNDRGLYSDYHEIFNELENDPPKPNLISADQSFVYHYSDQLRAWVEDILHPTYWSECEVDMPEWAINMLIDVGSQWRVDWDQLARRIVENIKTDREIELNEA